MKKIRLLSILMSVIMVLSILQGCSNKNMEVNMKKYNGYLEKLDTFPVSIDYEGKTYKGFKEGYTEIERNTSEKDLYVQTDIKLRHKDSNALFTVETRKYPKYGAYEWTVYITNDSDLDTGSFSDFNAGDIYFKGDNPCLKGINGDLRDWYAPYEKKITKAGLSFGNTSGRPTHGDFPYYNLEHGDGGTLIAVGWPGCWRAEFKSEGNSTHFTAGLMNFDTYLKPGETVRSPLMAFIEYSERDINIATNAWRRWFIDCNLRHFDGKPFNTVQGVSSMSQGINTNKVLLLLSTYYSHNINVEYLWLDAGWYTDTKGKTVEWPKTGTLLMNTKMFPDRMLDISNKLKENNGKLLLWFEPEVIRLDRETFLKDTPDFKEDWLLGKAFIGSWLEGEIVNLGNPDCVNYLVNGISKVIDDAGISMYRQDFNCDPAEPWRLNDDIDRIGITENKYAQGYLSFWDKLIEKYPDMMIDSCASGGGRNDLETMRRSVPLHYSDRFDGNPDDYNMKHGMVQALYAWFPYFKNQMSSAETNMYNLRSNYAPWFIMNASNPLSKEFPWDLFKRAQDEFGRIREFYYSDYYQLLPWNFDADKWNGWEFFDPEKDSGFIQLFRPEDNNESEKTIKLYGLNPNKTYSLTDFDGLLSITASGKELMKNGFKVTLTDARSSSVILITCVK